MVLEVLARTVLARPGEDITGIQLRKEEVKLSLFADDVILYWENLKDCIKELLELKTCGKVARFKINTQKSGMFLCTNTLSEK